MKGLPSDLRTYSIEHSALQSNSASLLQDCQIGWRNIVSLGSAHRAGMDPLHPEGEGVNVEQQGE